MRKTPLLTWLLVAIAGFALMLWAHRRTERVQEASRWGGGAMSIAEQELPHSAPRLGGRRAVVRLLPLAEETRQRIHRFRVSRGPADRAVRRNLQ